MERDSPQRLEGSCVPRREQSVVIVHRIGILIGLLFLLTSATAQRVVVLCLQPENVPSLIRQTADMPGAQALVLSRVASSPAQRPASLSPEQWERSAYLTLNAGTRALVPNSLSVDGMERLRQLVQLNSRWGYPVVIGLLPEELKARRVRFRYLTTRIGSPMLLAGAPFPEPDTRLVPDWATLLRVAQFVIRGHSRLMLWIDASGVKPEQLEDVTRQLQINLTQPLDALYLLCPVPSQHEVGNGSRLGWVMRLGRNGTGLLAANSTRLPGFITLPDLTATWLSHFGCTKLPSGVVGSPAQVVPDDEPAQATQRLYESLMRQMWWNRTIGTLPMLQAAALLLAVLIRRSFGRIIRTLWLFPCLLPVLGVSLAPVLICFPLGGISPAIRWGIWASCMIVLLGVLSRFPLGLSLHGLSAVLIIFAGVDLLRGGNLLRWSGFGYVLQEGARFYGVGNELAGSLFGAQSGFLLAESAGWSLLRWLLTALATGAPSWGANVGALLSALGVALSSAFLSRRLRLFAAVAVGAVLLGVVFWEISSPSPTHLGWALQHTQTLLLTVERKLRMNVTLLVSSAWTPLLLVGLAGLKGAPVPVWVGALALLLLNDSGVVAAAAMLAWWWAWRTAQQEANTGLQTRRVVKEAVLQPEHLA